MLYVISCCNLSFNYSVYELKPAHHNFPEPRLMSLFRQINPRYNQLVVNLSCLWQWRIKGKKKQEILTFEKQEPKNVCHFCFIVHLNSVFGWFSVDQPISRLLIKALIKILIPCIVINILWPFYSVQTQLHHWQKTTDKFPLSKYSAFETVLDWINQGCSLEYHLLLH